MSDTSEITNSSLVHYDSSHIQTRRDFMGLCKYSRDAFKEKRKSEPNQECMAKILRLIETLTDHAKAQWKLNAMKAEEKGLAKPREPKRYPLELSNGSIVRLIYDTFGESTVRNSLNYLLEIGYIGRLQEKKNGVPVYWLEQNYIQALLKAQAEVILAGYEFRPPSYQGAISYPDGVISNPSAVNSRPGHSQPGYDFTDNNIDKTEENLLDRDKIEERASKHSTENARALSLSENDSYRHEDTQITEGRIASFRTSVPDGERGASDVTGPTDIRRVGASRGKHNPIPGDMGAEGLSERQSQLLQGADEPPQEQVAIASMSGTPGQSPPSGESRQSLQSGPPTEQAQHATSGQKTPVSVLPAQTSSAGTTDGAATVGSGGEPRASGVTWQSCLDDWDAVQGRPQSRSDRMIKAAKEAVVANPTRDELRGCRDWLPTTDNPKDPWYKRRGVAYWDVIEKMGAYRSHLALSINPAPLADVKPPGPFDMYTQASMDPERNARNLQRLIDRRLAREAQARQQGGTP